LPEIAGLRLTASAELRARISCFHSFVLEVLYKQVELTDALPMPHIMDVGTCHKILELSVKTR